MGKARYHVERLTMAGTIREESFLTRTSAQECYEDMSANPYDTVRLVRVQNRMPFRTVLASKTREEQ